MSDDSYGVSAAKSNSITEAPALDYLPPVCKINNAVIGLIGTGGISEFHLKAYRKMGLNVVALCDRAVDFAQAKRDKFFPEASVYKDHTELLARKDITVVDITTHPEVRPKLIEDALNAGKHVLSQKPFVKDIAVGEKLVALAQEKGLKLAVNQNGRWAPHFRYITRALEAGLIGKVNTIDVCMQWDQTWIAGNEGFERIHHLVLYDFAIHWFDIVTRMMGDRTPELVYAAARKFEGQDFRPPALAHVVIEYPDAQARLLFNAHNRYGEEDSTTVTGTEGLIRSRGPRLTEQTVTLYNAQGEATPELKGDWFCNGFEGTMGELLCSIEDGREPENSAARNLKSLKLAFAAIASADAGKPLKPGDVTALKS
jgi:predicted dehydrogenase